MFVPNRQVSNEAIQNALFDYLNLNRHKFDEHGNFDQIPDERDYVPALLIADNVKPPKPPKWMIPKGTPVPPPTTRFVAPGKVWRKPSYAPDPTQPRHVRGKPVPLPKINRRYTADECEDMHRDEIIQCKEEWEGKWPKYAYGKCIGRANDRLNLCMMNGEYNPDSKPYSVNDLNDEDQKEYRRRKAKEQKAANPEPKASSDDEAQPAAPALPEGHSASSELYGWAKGQLKRFAPPPLESSMEDDPTFGQQPLIPLLPWRRIQRGIRATPGMGYMGGLGGGGKPRLFPRHPGDPRVPQKLY